MNVRWFLFNMNPGIQAFKSRVFASDLTFWIGVNKYWIVDILPQILLTLLTFIDLLILRKVLICDGWFLFGVSYYVAFQFAPWRVINGSYYGEQNSSCNVFY